ncbi:MAG: DUF4386 family protein [Nocardioides sp.]
MTSKTIPDAPSPSRTALLCAAVAALVFAFLLFVPLGVLGTAIGWPASLDDPAAVVMPRLVEHEAAVRLGYLAYLLYSILFLPLVILVSRALGDSWLGRAAIAFAALSALARAIGILRWLTVLPALAAANAAEPDPTIAVVFDAVDAYGGAIGELLGVSAFAAGAIGMLSVGMLRGTVLPRWLGVGGLAVAVGLLVPWIEITGADLGAVLTVTTSFVQIWFLALGVTLLATARRVG